MISRSRMGHYLAGLGLTVFALYAFLLWPGSGQAVTNSPVGEFGVAVVPVGTTAEAEYLDLSFPTTAAGAVLDVTGWSVAVNGTPVAVLSTTSIPANSLIRLCSTAGLIPDCLPSWDGAVFPDEGGTVAVFDAAGSLVANVTYNAVDTSVVVYETFGWNAPLYSTRDRVAYCSTRDGVKFRETKEQAAKIVEGIKGRPVVDATAIVPPFYHRLDTTLGYYQGQNWTPENAAKHANGCQ